MADKRHFCTIINPNFIDYIKVQYEFLRKFDANLEIHLLVSTTDIRDIQTPQYKELPPSIKCYTVNDVCQEGVGKAIYDKYFLDYTDGFRWSMKPVFLNYLLNEKVTDKIIFMDWDIVFFDDYNFLFDDLDKYDVLLTPHWFATAPFETDSKVEEQWFESNFKSGLFNAGFFAANRNASHLLQWWAEICLYKCELNYEKGFFGDQHYLNLFPFLSEKIGIVRHKGCNLSYWNRIECNRIEINNKVLINSTYPVIFIHFNSLLTDDILEGKEELLKPYFDSYAAKYKEITNQTLPAISRYYLNKESANKTSVAHQKQEWLILLKEKLRIRTRIKRFLEG